MTESEDVGKQSTVQEILDNIDFYKKVDITKAMNNGLFTNDIFYPLRISKMILFMLIDLFGEEGRVRSRGIRELVLNAYLKKNGKIDGLTSSDTEIKTSDKRVKELEQNNKELKQTIKELTTMFFGISIVVADNNETLDYDNFAKLVGGVDSNLINAKITELIGDATKIEKLKEKIKKELLV